MSTGKSDLYKWPEEHEFPHFLLSYTEDQAGQYIRPEDELRARNGYWFTNDEADQFKYNNTMGTVTYGREMHGVWAGTTSVHHMHETQLLRIRYHVHPRERGTNTVH